MKKKYSFLISIFLFTSITSFVTGCHPDFATIENTSDTEVNKWINQTSNEIKALISNKTEFEDVTKNDLANTDPNINSKKKIKIKMENKRKKYQKISQTLGEINTSIKKTIDKMQRNNLKESDINAIVKIINNFKKIDSQINIKNINDLFLSFLIEQDWNNKISLILNIFEKPLEVLEKIKKLPNTTKEIIKELSNIIEINKDITERLKKEENETITSENNNDQLWKIKPSTIRFKYNKNRNQTTVFYTLIKNTNPKKTYKIILLVKGNIRKISEIKQVSVKSLVEL